MSGRSRYSPTSEGVTQWRCLLCCQHSGCQTQVPKYQRMCRSLPRSQPGPRLGSHSCLWQTLLSPEAPYNHTCQLRNALRSGAVVLWAALL